MNLLDLLYDIDFIKFGDFKLKSSIESPYYLDLMIIMSNPTLLKQLCSIIYNNYIIKYKNISILGLSYAGIPYASTLSIQYNIPLLILRKEDKNYGTKNIIEGITP